MTYNKTYNTNLVLKIQNISVKEKIRVKNTKNLC